VSIAVLIAKTFT